MAASSSKDPLCDCAPPPACKKDYQVLHDSSASDDQHAAVPATLVLSIGAAPPLPDGPTTRSICSIYDLWSPRRRAVILAVVSISQFLNPFSSSIMLPGLKDLEAAFHAGSTAGAAVLGLYYFPLGLSSLGWGPLIDLWGRKSCYLAATSLFALATLGCVFAQNIAMLLAFRALQGVALGAYRGAGIGTIADIYPPAQRGLAIGILLLSTLVGPVLGPLLGGFLAQAYGWRAPFVALLVFAAGIILPLTLVLVSETHQWRTLRRLDPAAVACIREAPFILAHPPKCGSPWAPIVAVLDPRIVLHLLQTTVGFAAMISAQTELTGQLVAPPYSLSPAVIGCAFLVTGLSGMVASPLGGRLYDQSAASSAQPMVRLKVNCLTSLIGMPTGLLLYGWAAQFRAHLALVLLGLGFVGFSMCVHLPAFMGMLSIVKQKEAGTASSGQNAITFVVCGVLVLAGSAVSHGLGLGWYMTILAVLHALIGLLALRQILRVWAHQQQLLGAVPDVPAGVAAMPAAAAGSGSGDSGVGGASLAAQQQRLEAGASAKQPVCSLAVVEQQQ